MCVAVEVRNWGGGGGVYQRAPCLWSLLSCVVDCKAPKLQTDRQLRTGVSRKKQPPKHNLGAKIQLSYMW